MKDSGHKGAPASPPVGKPRRDWHDYLRSGWTIIGIGSLVVGSAFQVGRFVESLSKPPAVAQVPESLRTELRACRTLAYMAERQCVGPRRDYKQ